MFAPGESYGFYPFLGKFDILRRIPWSENDIRLVATYVVDGLLREHIEYSEIRFSVNKYLPFLGLDHVQIIRLVRKLFDEATADRDVDVGLVLALKFETEDHDELDAAYRLSEYGDCVVGIDLVGDEAKFDVDKFRGIMQYWHDGGKGITVHAGESQPAHNVRLAINELHATRIAHGIRVPQEDGELLNECRERDICFEIAISSNVMTGLVTSIEEHPARRMLDNGNSITIGTDDPVICQTSLSKELSLAQWHWNLTNLELEDIKANSIKYAFR